MCLHGAGLIRTQYIYIYTYIHTYIHTHTHTINIHTCIHTHTQPHQHFAPSDRELWELRRIQGLFFIKKNKRKKILSTSRPSREYFSEFVWQPTQPQPLVQRNSEMNSLQGPYVGNVLGHWPFRMCTNIRSCSESCINESNCIYGQLLFAQENIIYVPNYAAVETRVSTSLIVDMGNHYLRRKLSFTHQST